jgi:hypothetical protein
VVEKENARVRIDPNNFTACEKRWRNEVYNRYVHRDPSYSLFAI